MIDIHVAATFLVLMFLISGASKVLSLGASEAARFARRTGLGFDRASRFVFLAGVWELVGALYVLRGIWLQHGPAALRSVERGAAALGLFTIAATAVFYVAPFRPHPVLANMTALAGLALLPRVCELRHA